MKIRTDFVWGLVAFVILATSLSVLNKGLFVASVYTGDDGFYQQMLPFLTGVSFADLHVLQYVHFLRYIVVSPFIYGDLHGLGGVFYSIVLVLFSLPILSATKNSKYASVRYIILLIPIFVSFRVFLVACSIAYLYVAIFGHKSTVLMLASLLLSSLSSSVVLIWILMLIINFRSVSNNYKLLFYMIGCMIFVVFLPSFLHKLDYANEILEGYTDYFLRGTLAVSFMEGQWLRFVFYVVILMSVLSVAVRALLPSKFRMFYLSYMVFLIGAMFEGAGLISGVIVVAMFFYGFRPRFVPSTYIRVADETS